MVSAKINRPCEILSDVFQFKAQMKTCKGKTVYSENLWDKSKTIDEWI